MATITLERSDLLQLDPISSKGTLKLLPIGKKHKQKLLIGDDSGQLSCYEFKKGEPQVVFQTKVFDGPVSCICLGGNPQKRDKVFLSHSQRIVGLTKKGKEFFKLTSTLTEPIRKIVVEDTRIWTGCENIYNLFDDGKDAAYFISRGQINDLIVANVTRDTDFDTVLACQDKFIRIIRTSQLFAEIPTDFPVTALGFLQLERDVATLSARKPSFVIFGTSRGTIGIIQVNANGSYEILWEIDDDDKRNCVNCINVYDINKDGVAEIIIGRDDGRIEVFKIQPDNMLAEPIRLFCKDIGESVRSVESGIVNTQDYPEIVVAAYSGKLISFTTEPLRARAAEDAYGRSIQTVNNENRIKSLRKEVDELKKQLEKSREKLKKLQPSTGTSASAAAMAAMRAPTDFPVNSQFDLDTLHAAYTLNIELQTPIDLLVIRSPVVLDLVESDNSSSVLSVTPPGDSNEDMSSGGGKFMAVFRCQNAERRLSLNLRTNEGEFGELVLTIVAAMNPKAAKVVKYELKPLSLHTRVHALTDEETSRPRHRLRYTGNISTGTSYEWISAIFPDVPPRLDEEIGDQRFYFRNTFTLGTAIAEIRRNEIIIESESASVIAIAKENLTRMANYRRTAVEESITPSNNAVMCFFNLLSEKLEYQQALERKVQLVDAIHELSLQENSSPAWLSSEYREILAQQETIRREYKSRTRALEYLCGIITDLFVDWHRIQGNTDVRRKLPQLQQLIVASNVQSLIKYFLE